MSSLAGKLSPRLGRYYAGLWQHNMLIGLQWESLDGFKSHRHEDYIAPSFTWASRTGSVVWYLPPEDLVPKLEERDFAQIVDIQCTLSSNDIFGQVSDGFIKIRGYVAIMCFEDEDRAYSLGKLKLEQKLVLERRSKFMQMSKLLKIFPKSKQLPRPAKAPAAYVCMDTFEDMIEAKGKVAFCLDIMRDRKSPGYIAALVLMPATDRPGNYRRLGLSTMETTHFENASMMEVVII